MENGNALEAVGAGLVMRPDASDIYNVVGIYRAECLDANGNVKWAEDFPNTVVDIGKRWLLDQGLSATASNPGTVYMGLVNGASAPTIAGADTMSSHAGWTEITSVTANRGTASFSAASGSSKATSSNVSFSITGSATVAGVFLVIGGTNANGNTTGTLFSAGSFSGGNRAVVNGDTLNVSYSVSI